MRPLEPIQRVRRWHAYLVVWRVHRWLALGLGAVIVVLSLTGSVLVVHHAVERWVHPDRHVVDVPPDANRAPIVPILLRLQEKAPPGFRPLRLEPGHGATDADKYLFVGPDARTRWAGLVNPYSGTELWSGPDQGLFTPWLLHFHMHFQAGRWGYVVAGLAGIALTSLGLTGLWITRDRLGALFRHPFRRRLGRRVALADLHKWIGAASLYFTLVLGGTGVWFSILIVPGQFREKPAPPATTFDLTQLAAIEPAITTTLARFPGSELMRIAFPATPTSPLQVRVLHRDAPVWRKQSRVDFDPRSGVVLKIRDARDATTAEKWNSILAPLHFGYFGSPLVQALYVIGGLAPTALALTGTAIWRLRTRKLKRVEAQY